MSVFAGLLAEEEWWQILNVRTWAVRLLRSVQTGHGFLMKMSRCWNPSVFTAKSWTTDMKTSQWNYCVRGCALLATGRFSMFYHMPAMVQRDEGVKLLGNHSICVIWACRHHLSALTQNLVKPGLNGSCSLTDAVNSYKKMSPGSGSTEALASICSTVTSICSTLAGSCSTVASVFKYKCGSWRHTYCTYQSSSVPKITLNVTGKGEELLTSEVAMRVISTSFQLQRDSSVNHTLTRGVNKENILGAVSSVWGRRFCDW